MCGSVARGGLRWAACRCWLTNVITVPSSKYTLYARTGFHLVDMLLPGQGWKFKPMNGASGCVLCLGVGVQCVCGYVMCEHAVCVCAHVLYMEGEWRRTGEKRGQERRGGMEGGKRR